MEEREMYIHKYIHIVKMRSNSGLGVLVEMKLYRDDDWYVKQWVIKEVGKWAIKEIVER